MFFGFFRKKTTDDNYAENGGGLIHGIDPSMKYCPSCGGEYRADFKVCGICNMALVDGVEKLDEVERKLEKRRTPSRLEMVPDADLIVVQKGGIREMKMLRNKLKEEGIPSLLSSEQSGCGKSCCGPEMQLLVNQEDLLDVEEVLTQDYVKTTALESHQLKGLILDGGDRETVCPACQCRFSPTVGGCPDCGLKFD